MEQSKPFLLNQYEDEVKVSLGNLYPNELFYYIRLGKGTIHCGLGAISIHIIKHLYRAMELDAIPVIDLSQHWNVYINQNEIGIVNPWEYYFEQPTFYTVSAVRSAKNVILSNTDTGLGYFSPDNFFENLDKAYEVYNKYIHISSRVQKELSKEYSKVFKNKKENGKILGVTYRGSDYRNGSAIGEFKQPSLEQLAKDASYYMNEWVCQNIFLVTEDQGGLEYFKDIFGDKLLYVERERYPSNVAKTYAYKLGIGNNDKRYLKGECYLKEMVLQSKCDCWLTSIVGSAFMVAMLNENKFEHKYIYNFGKYTEPNYK